MRFLLVDPPHKIWTILRAWTPSPGCLQLLAYLEREQFDIEYMDCTLNENPWRDLEEKIRTEKPEVVGISVICTAFVYDGMNAASLIKAANPKTIVIMGGEHPSFMAEETLRDCPAIDYICVGEGEVTLAEFLRAVGEKQDLSRVLGLGYLNEKGEFVYTGDRPFIEDLDTLPMPAYHLAKMGPPVCDSSVGREERACGQFFKRMPLGLHVLLGIGLLQKDLEEKESKIDRR